MAIHQHRHFRNLCRLIIYSRIMRIWYFSTKENVEQVLECARNYLRKMIICLKYWNELFRRGFYIISQRWFNARSGMKSDMIENGKPDLGFSMEKKKNRLMRAEIILNDFFVKPLTLSSSSSSHSNISDERNEMRKRRRRNSLSMLDNNYSRKRIRKNSTCQNNSNNDTNNREVYVVVVLVRWINWKYYTTELFMIEIYKTIEILLSPNW